MTHRQTRFGALPVALALTGIAVPLVGSDFIVWQLSLLWLLVLAVVVLVERRLQPARSTRVFCELAALPLLLLLGFEGGWWPSRRSLQPCCSTSGRAAARRMGS